MNEERQHQPSLTEIEDQQTRMAGNSSSSERNRRIATVVTTLMVAAGVSQLFTGERVSAQDEQDDEPVVPTATSTRNPNIGLRMPGTPTPEPSSDNGVSVAQVSTFEPTSGSPDNGVAVAQESTLTPTPGRTEVAALPANAFTLEFNMSGYPNRLDFTSRFGSRINTEIDLNQPALVDAQGHALAPGVYFDRPVTLDPSVMNFEVSMDGVEAEQSLLVGFITFEPNPPAGPIAYINVPMRLVNPDGSIDTQSARTGYMRFSLPFRSTGTVMHAVNPDGTEVESPSGINDDQPIPRAENPNTSMVWNAAEQTMTFPTAEGIVTIHNGDEVGVFVIKNLEEIPFTASIVSENNNQTFEQMVAALMNNDPTDDAVKAFIYDLGIMVAQR